MNDSTEIAFTFNTLLIMALNSCLDNNLIIIGTNDNYECLNLEVCYFWNIDDVYNYPDWLTDRIAETIGELETFERFFVNPFTFLEFWEDDGEVLVSINLYRKMK